MINWEYRLVSLANFDPPTPDPGGSAAVSLLNDEGLKGWEAVGITTLDGGECAVLMKKALAQGRQGGSRI